MKTQCLKDRVIVVTGGNGLIGSQFVRAVADAGAIAISADLREPELSTAYTSPNDAPTGAIESAICDITCQRSIDELCASLMAKYGRIDGLVNNAYPRNAAYGRHVEDVTYADFCENLGSHVGGYFLMIQRFLPALRQAPLGGAIVNMGSIYGSLAPRFSIYENTPMTMPVEYAAIKAAILQLTRYFAQYLKPDGIRVNCLSPGGIADQQPQEFVAAYNRFAGKKGMLAASDLVGTLVYLLGDSARYVNGQNIIVDDGWSL